MSAYDEIKNKKQNNQIDEPKDEVLIAAIKSGDQKAYKMLVQRYLNKLWRLAMSILQDEEEAEDAVQEVFLTLWQSLDKWEASGPALFSTWLYRVTFNKCIDIKRGRKPNISEDQAPEQTTNPDAYNNVLQSEISGKMADHMNALPGSQQTVMMMYYYEELSVNEISAKLGATEQSVRSLLKRGRKNLKDKIQYDQAFKSWDFSGSSEHIWS